jgi:predicted DNA binding CopG/RHH family protein
VYELRNGNASMIEGCSLGKRSFASELSKSGKINLRISSSDWNPIARKRTNRGILEGAGEQTE